MANAEALSTTFKMIGAEQREIAQPVRPLSSQGAPTWIFGLAIFISAFLLFQVELIIAKFMLPWFGGTAAVWATCLLFFQVILFAGYFYTHKISSSLRLNQQGKIHLVFLAVAGLFILWAWFSWGSPFLPGVDWKPIPGSAPILGIVRLLLIAIGLPFLLLSSTGPLLQKWHDEIHHRPGSEPSYFFYAISNAGSIAGLLSYPIILERTFGLNLQSKLWGAGFAFFVVCCAICGRSALRAGSAPQPGFAFKSEASGHDGGPAQPPRQWLWFFLPALGSVMLLATTNLVTQDVAPVPLLWVLPLSLYLLSFILTFQKNNWYSRGIFHPLFALTSLVTLIALFRGVDMNILKQVGVFLSMLFVACMVCHGELARIKPPTRYLTAFYLTIAAGGAFGGIFVGIIAPFIFPAVWEYHLGLWAIAGLIALILFLDKDSWLRDPNADPWIAAVFFAILFLLPKYLAHIGMITIPVRLVFTYSLVIYLVVGLLLWVALRRRGTSGSVWPWNKLTVWIAFLLLSAALCADLARQKGRLLHRERNFYGALSVRQQWDADLLHSNFTLMHGRIVHGIQIEQDRRLATTYYDTKSGVGLALTSNPQRRAGGMRVGAIGLGAGTVAAYGRADDVYRFYEINPAVIRLAQGGGGYFTFLKDSPARIDIVPGDARLSLEAAAARHEFQNFDVLIVDAFNGDAIPIHLLTREAMKLYLLHLRGPESVIAVHISNLAVDLAPVVASLAKLYGMHGSMITTKIDTGVIVPSEWILLTQGDSLNVSEIQSVGKPILAFTNRDNAVWTDDYSDILSLFDYHGFSIKSWLHRSVSLGWQRKRTGRFNLPSNLATQ